MADRIKPKGIVTFKKHEKAPEKALGTLIITFEDLESWFKGEGKKYQTDYQGKKQIKFDMYNGEYGVTISVNTYGLKIEDDVIPGNEPDGWPE